MLKISPFGRNDKGVRKDNSGFAKLAEFLKVSLDSRFRGNDTGVRFTISDSLSLWNLSWFHWIPDHVRDVKEVRNDMLTKISPFGRNDTEVRKTKIKRITRLRCV